MGSTPRTSLILLLSLLVTAIHCSTATAPGHCADTIDIAQRLSIIRSSDWRHVQQTVVVSQWNAVGIDNGYFEHCALQRDKECNCRESLVFERGDNPHLRAMEITRRESEADQALTTIRDLVAAATGRSAPDSLGKLRSEASYSQQSLGWTTPEYDTILEVSIKRDGRDWIANFYWSRSYL